jgi:nitrite reductase/ring-hydroxylating ferredoxin subunit
MAEPVKLCPTSEIPENSVKRFDVGNYVLAVYHVDGEFYATDDECTHGCASLAEGELDGHVIECGLHFGAFDVRTGAAVQAPCFTPVRTYKVEVRDGQIFVDTEKEAGG